MHAGYIFKLLNGGEQSVNQDDSGGEAGLNVTTS